MAKKDMSGWAADKPWGTPGIGVKNTDYMIEQSAEYDDEATGTAKTQLPIDFGTGADLLDAQITSPEMSQTAGNLMMPSGDNRAAKPGKRTSGANPFPAMPGAKG